MLWQRKKINIWIVLHTPELLKNRPKEITLSLHSHLILDESRPTKLLGSNTIHLKGRADIFLARLEIERGTPLFLHAMAVIRTDGEGNDSVWEEKSHHIGYRNLKIEAGFSEDELLIDIGEFELYSLCRPLFAPGHAA